MEVGHKDPVKTENTNHMEKTNSGWNNTAEEKKRKKTATTATHQLTSHPRNVFLVTTPFNR